MYTAIVNIFCIQTRMSTFDTTKTTRREETHNYGGMSLQVGYYDPFGIYPLIQPSLETKLPLTNLHWKIDNAIKSIPKLPIDLVEEVPKRMIKATAIRLMFVKCNDMSMYKSQVRPLIKEWLKLGCSDGSVEWLIILYTPLKKDSSSSSSKISLKGSVYEKLKVDFNKDGRQLIDLQLSSDGVDRCFRLKETNDNELNKLEIYNELVNRIKQLVLDGFTKKLSSSKQLVQQAETKNEPLAAVNLLVNMSNHYLQLYLFKESFTFLNEVSHKFKQYYNISHKSESEIKYTHELGTIDFTNPFNTLISNSEHMSILTETSVFKILTYIFYHKHLVLSKLISNEPLVSIKATYLTSLYQELIQYLNDLSTIFRTKAKDSKSSVLILVYNFKLADKYLLLEDTKQIIEAGTKSNDIDLSSIFEFMGDLKLFQRDNLIKLAELNQYFYTDEMESIPLDDSSNDTILELLDDTDKSLRKILDSKDSYFQYFQKLTESVIEDFVHCGRIKSIDVLSIDLALLHYNQHNYEQVINILQDSFEYFIDNGWNYMGNKLLSIYINSVEKVTLHPSPSKDDNNSNRSLLIVNSYIKLINNLKLSNKKCDINRQVTMNLNLSINNILINKILPLCDSLPNTLIIPLKSFFEPLPLVPKFGFNHEVLKYTISVKILNKFNIKRTADSVMLELSNGLVFSSEDVDLTSETGQETTFDLYANIFIKGFYNPVKLIINFSDKLSLVHEFEGKKKINDTFIGGDNDSVITSTGTEAYKTNNGGDAWDPEGGSKVKERKNSILNDSLIFDGKTFVDEHNQVLRLISDHDLYYHEIPNTFKVEIGFTNSYLLGSPSLTVKLRNEYLGNEIRDISVEYLQLDGFKFMDKLLMNDTIDRIAGNSTKEIRKDINITSEGDCYVKTKVNYWLNGQQYEYSDDSVISCRLIVSVTVQDIFKTDSIFLNFQIGSIIDSPLRINSIDLKPVQDGNQDNVIVNAPKVPLENQVILKDQILNSFYKIMFNPKQEAKALLRKTLLQLTINYNSLMRECRNHLQQVFRDKLQDEAAVLLLRDIIIPFCKFDYNRYLIDNQLCLTNRSEILKLVNLISKYISTEVTNGTTCIIRQIIDSNQTLDVLNEDIIRHTNNQLLINVPLPHIDVLQIVEFKYPKQNQYLVGEPIEMELVIESNTKWEPSSKKQARAIKHQEIEGRADEEDLSIIAESSSILDDTTGNQDQLFQFNLINDENWSVSGFKKKILLVNLAEPVTVNRFLLLLIPLTIGKLSLPKFYLKLVDQSVDLTIDISFKNGNETLLVVPELDKITFSF